MFDVTALIAAIDGHKIGANKVHTGIHSGFVYIPKCASTSVRAACYIRGYRDSDTVREDVQYYAVVRDPWQRYLSGLAQFVLVNYGADALAFPEDVYSAIFVDRKWSTNNYDEFHAYDQSVFLDQHTLPQWLYLTPFDTSLIVVHMSALSELRELLNVGEIPHKNQMTSARQDFCTTLSQLLLANREWLQSWYELVGEMDAMLIEPQYKGLTK
jgi:hypothetical protein